MGVGLLVVVVLKLFLMDLAATEALTRIIAFLGIGLLLLGLAMSHRCQRTEQPDRVVDRTWSVCTIESFSKRLTFLDASKLCNFDTLCLLHTFSHSFITVELRVCVSSPWVVAYGVMRCWGYP